MIGDQGGHREDHADRHGFGGPDQLDLTGYPSAGASHYEDIFGFGYDETGPVMFGDTLRISQPEGSDWSIGPWFGAVYPYWYDAEDCGGGQISFGFGVGDPSIAEPDEFCETEPGTTQVYWDTFNDNYGNLGIWHETYAEDFDGNYVDLFVSQQVGFGSASTNQICLQSENADDAGTYTRVIVSADVDFGAFVLINGPDDQNDTLFTASSAGQVMLQVLPLASSFGGVHMGFETSVPSFGSPQTFVPWVDQTNNILKFRVRYSDGTYKTGEVVLF